MATRKAHNLETVLALCRFDPDSRNIGFEPFIKQELLRAGYPLTVRAMWVGIPPMSSKATLQTCERIFKPTPYLEDTRGETLAITV